MPAMPDTRGVVRSTRLAAHVGDRARHRLHAGQVADRDRRAGSGRWDRSSSRRCAAPCRCRARQLRPQRKASQSFQPESYTRPGSSALFGLHVAGALAEDQHRVGVRCRRAAVEHVTAGGHQRRLDRHRRPARVRLLEQRREAGHVRAGHRGAAVAGRSSGRRCPAAPRAARMSWPGAIRSGLSRSPPPAQQRAARREATP